jgi:hypothetical protein
MKKYKKRLKQWKKRQARLKNCPDDFSPPYDPKPKK